MASISILFFILVLTCVSVGRANSGFVNVHCKAENIGQYGQQSLLDCVIHFTAEVSNPEIRIVAWKKVGAEPVLIFNHEGLEDKKGYTFAEPSWKKNMNISLLITNTDVKHEGDYECMVFTDSGDATGKTKLKVTAKYTVPTIHPLSEKLPVGAESALICNCDGGYPQVRLRWFDEYNTDWTKSSKMEAYKSKNDLFHLSSRLIVYPGSKLNKYICVVFNSSGGKESEATFETSEPRSGDPSPEKVGQMGKNPSKIVAPVVVIGSLIVGLLLLLVIMKRRAKTARRQSTAPLMDEHQEVSINDAEEGQDEEMNKKC
uniref:Ig-like domain-containing protein n=1 Tax=Anabas testudineus TaxID=64144 RepID=A0A3Q1HDJ5_ANATE